MLRRGDPSPRGSQPAGMPENPRRGNPSNPVPSQFQQPKGGGRLVSTHAALSPELGSKLKARSGRKSGTTAPGVQGAGRGPRRFLWLLSCPRKKVTRLSGRDPTTPPAGCRKMLRRENPSPRGSQPAGMPENSKRKKLKGDPAGRPQAANTKLGPPLAPAGPPPHRGGRFPPSRAQKRGALGAFLL